MKAVVIDHQEFYRAGFIQSLQQLDAYQFDPVIDLDFSKGVYYLETEIDIGFIAFDTAILDLEIGARFKQALGNHPSSLVLALSNQCNQYDAASLFAMGVNALLPKSADQAALHQLLQLVSNQGFCMPSNFNHSQPIVKNTRLLPSLSTDLPSEMARLTKRQKDILQIVMEGKSNKEISRILGISAETVRTHLKNIFKMLKATSRTEAAYIATQYESRLAHLN